MRRAAAFLTTLGLGIFARQDAGAEALRLGTYVGYSHAIVNLEFDKPSGLGGEFVPPVTPRQGIDARYGNFGISFSAPLNTRDWRGQGGSATQGLNDLRTHWLGDSWGFEVHHRSIRGFEANPTGPVEEGHLDHPDMTLRLSGLTVYRAIDPDARVYRLSEGAMPTGGGVDAFLMLSAQQARLRDDRPFMRDGANGRVQDLGIASLAMGGGYALSGNMHGIYIDQAMFAGYGPQHRVLGDREKWTFDLVKFNLRLRTGIRNRWFDAGVGVDHETHAALDGEEEAKFHSLVARAGLELFL